MKSLIIIVLIAAGASAANYGGYSSSPILIREAPASYSGNSYGLSSSSMQLKQIPITSFSQNIRGSQENDMSYSTGNGISVVDHTQSVNRPSTYEAEEGRIVQSPITVVKSGSFSFSTVQGQPISLSYVADENGFRAEGAHLPVAPAQIQKTPEVLQAEAEHLALYREVLAKAPASSSLSYDESPQLLVRSSSYAAPAVIRSSSPSYAAPAPQVVRASAYAPASVLVEPIQIRIESSGY